MSNINTHPGNFLVFAEIHVEIEKVISVSLSYPYKMKKIYLQGMWELCKSERISCQTSKRTHVISWSLLRFVEKYKRWFRFQYPIHINCWKNPTCKKCKDDVNLKEYLTIQACKSLVLLRFMWLMEKVILCYAFKKCEDKVNQKEYLTRHQ